jgi:hypothetical protein
MGLEVAKTKVVLKCCLFIRFKIFKINQSCLKQSMTTKDEVTNVQFFKNVANVTIAIEMIPMLLQEMGRDDK